MVSEDLGLLCHTTCVHFADFVGILLGLVATLLYKSKKCWSMYQKKMMRDEKHFLSRC